MFEWLKDIKHNRELIRSGKYQPGNVVETVLHADNMLPTAGVDDTGEGWERVWDEATDDWAWERPWRGKEETE